MHPSRLLPLVLAIASSAACKPSNTGGVDLHGKPHVGIIAPPAASKDAVKDPTAPEDPKTPDPDAAHHWAWTAIGCFIGGPWSEALGAIGEERVLADTKRCREVATGPLGAKEADSKALDAVRSLDADAIARVLAGIKTKFGNKPDDKLLELVGVTAEAAREAIAVRRVTESMRKVKGKSTDQDVATLSAQVALEKLGKLGIDEAKLVQLILGADHVESSRGLDARGKIYAAAPAFQVLFGVSPPKLSSDATQSDWVAYLSAAAKAAGHAPKEKGAAAPGSSTSLASPASSSSASPTSSTSSASPASPPPLPTPPPTLDEQEQAAFTAIARGFADRFAALGKSLPPSVAKGAANGYATRLRTELADANAKLEAKSLIKDPANATKTKVGAKTKATPSKTEASKTEASKTEVTKGTDAKKTP